jgi:solute carrier family 40 (iron-regulated transporter), member 1
MLYFRHRDFLPSLALSLLYLTVLSFAGQMVTYLLSVGYNSTQIGLIRTISVAFEISATWLAPLLMKKVGVVRAGLWSISWQILCISAAVALFLMVQEPFLSAASLIAGVIGSRIGLWAFDLCVQSIVQEVRTCLNFHTSHANPSPTRSQEVQADRRGSFSSMEASFQNVFELCAYASTIVWARPAQFRYPVLLSSAAIFMAGALYTKFVRDRRGHLLHVSNCLKVRERADGRYLGRYAVLSG